MLCRSNCDGYVHNLEYSATNHTHFAHLSFIPQMNYEAVRKLKEAGYPQDKGLAPTLEQLIGLCADFRKLIRYPMPDQKVHWMAFSGLLSAEGSTAYDAVANLWIETKTNEM